MNKTEELFKVYLQISTAAEISCATLAEFMKNLDEEPEQYYILPGVSQQLEKIKEAVEKFDDVMSTKGVA